MKPATPAYYNFLSTNAHAVWFNDRNVFNQLGLKWDGPFDTADASRQSSALMAVSALAEPITAGLAFAKGSGDPAFSHSVGGSAGTLAWTATPANATRADYPAIRPLCFLSADGPHAAHFQLAVNALSGSGVKSGPAGCARKQRRHHAGQRGCPVERICRRRPPAGFCPAASPIPSPPIRWSFASIGTMSPARRSHRDRYHD